MGRDRQIFSLFLLKNARLHYSIYQMIMTCLITDVKANTGDVQKELIYTEHQYSMITSIKEATLAI